MSKKLLNDNELSLSPIVANNAMNRERKAVGINSYEKEIKINPIQFILSRKSQKEVKWIDLCCGQGNALIQAAKHFQETSWNNKLKLIGVDLVDFFSDYKSLNNIKLKVFDLSKWKPDDHYDLITIVHGLHYVGDKIGLIIKASSALKENGIFIGNLDIRNIRLNGCKNSSKIIKSFFEKEQINYNARTKILKITGKKSIINKFEYCGANDKAGKNYTGQDVVDSIYNIKAI